MEKDFSIIDQCFSDKLIGKHRPNDLKKCVAFKGHSIILTSYGSLAGSRPSDRVIPGAEYVEMLVSMHFEVKT